MAVVGAARALLQMELGALAAEDAFEGAGVRMPELTLAFDGD